MVVGHSMTKVLAVTSKSFQTCKTLIAREDKSLLTCTFLSIMSPINTKPNTTSSLFVKTTK